MRITATDLEQWADKNEAHGDLPLLVRRLLNVTTTTQALTLPSGDSINQPGWDGRCSIIKGNAWVPAGEVFLEISCRKDIDQAAQENFGKRNNPHGKDVTATFIFVTARRWRKKSAWLNKARAEGKWSDVHTIDADDLEAWLETAPAVACWFGEHHLGLIGNGVCTIERYWENWRGQSRLPITSEALLFGREQSAKKFAEAIGQRQSLLTLAADSREEALAFACARLLDSGQADYALCVTTSDGWRYFEQNANLSIGLAASPEAAKGRAPCEGSVLLIPVCADEQSIRREANALYLDRLTPSQFESALKLLGTEESDAVRLARTTGRSWSVYRRETACNEAIRNPAWLRHSDATCLSAVLFIGTWDGARNADRECIEHLTGKTYADVEAALARLALEDDAPVLRIGSTWYAKSPRELLRLYGPRLTSEELRRYFEVARAVLSKPDPALELPDDQRWMAAVYGKARAESDYLIDAVADSLVKLSVYAERNPECPADEVLRGVQNLVRSLLHEADGERWLSLSNVLQELAEAAPALFLTEVEASLDLPHAPMTRLFSETGKGSSSFGGRCWYADLLWALEILAWPANQLTRVANILARLCWVPKAGNWGNSAMGSLSSLFRYWLPQTTASTEQRLKTLDYLLNNHNDIAWDLLRDQLPSQHEVASPNARPHWRDDDAGSYAGVTYAEAWPYLLAIGERLIAHAQNQPERIASLVNAADSLDLNFRDRVIGLVSEATALDDAGKEAVRIEVRQFLHWQNSFNRDGARPGRETADLLAPLYEMLAPQDTVLRHAWLFKYALASLPEGREDNYEEADKVRSEMRARALTEIFVERQWEGISALADSNAQQWLLGREIVRLPTTQSELFAWLFMRFREGGHRFQDELVSRALHALPDDTRREFLQTHLTDDEATPNVALNKAALLTCAPCQRDTWGLLDSLSDSVSTIYWHEIKPELASYAKDDLLFLLEKLIAAKRSRTAFKLVEYRPADVPSLTLLCLLKNIAQGEEPRGCLPDGWRIGEMLDVLEKSREIPRRELARVEFPFVHALEHSAHDLRNLQAELLDDPALFMECINLMFKSPDDENKDVNAGSTTAAELAWLTLHKGSGVPGLQADGVFNAAHFFSWIRQVRDLAHQQNRLDYVDTTIGEWLSASPVDSDDHWPHPAICELLEQSDAKKLRNGFAIGIFNNRGVTTRGIYEGGNQERVLAQKYRDNAAKLDNSYPKLAATFRDIAEDYEYRARNHDNDAKRNKEGR